MAKNIHEHLDSVKNSVENSFLRDAVKEFEEMSKEVISLELIDNWRPFNKAFWAIVKSNYQQLPLKMLGSGYEMIFSFLLAFHLSKQSGRELICLIDEPELHLHPSLQEKFVKLLLESSKTMQIVIATHSPILVKEFFSNSEIKVHIVQREYERVKVFSKTDQVLPYISANEINYLAFNFPTTEYHDELYGHLMEINGKYEEKEMIKLLHSEEIVKRDWCRESSGEAQGANYEAPLPVFIRNKTHHPENKTMRSSNFSTTELKQSIDYMINIARNFRTT